MNRCVEELLAVPRGNDEQLAAAVTDSAAKPAGNVDCSTWEGSDGRAVENLTFAGQMKILPDFCAQIIIEHLDLGDFDRLRSSAPSVLKFTSLHESRVLRRQVESLSLAGQVTRATMRSLATQKVGIIFWKWLDG